MTERDAWEEHLRETWAGTPPAEAGACAPAATIWSAAQGELAPDEVARFVDHAAVCGRCADAWRLARLLPPPAPAAAAPRPRAWRGGRALLPLAAAILLAVVLVPWALRRDAPSGSWRGEGQAVVPLLDEGVPLSRAACRLRWTPGPEGTRYRLSLSSLDGSLALTLHDLAEPEFEVPADALRSIPPGGTLLWRVVAILPDGSEQASPTARATLE